MGCKWKRDSLGSLLSYIGKGIVPSYTERKSESVGVLGQKCVRNQRVDYSQIRFHNESGRPIKNEKISRVGDILINATGVGSAGRVAQIIDEPACRCTTDGHVITLRSRDGINPLYLGYFVKSRQRQIEQMAEGSTGQTELNRRRLQEEVFVSYPEDLNTQKKIAGIGLSIDCKISANRRANDYLAA